MGKTIGEWQPSSGMLAVRDAVAEMYRVSPRDITGRSKLQHITVARQVACWVVRQCFPQLSFPMIGRMVGDRDHSTVIHACKRVEEERAADPGFAAATDAIVQALGGQRTQRGLVVPDAASIAEVAERYFPPEHGGGDGVRVSEQEKARRRRCLLTERVLERDVRPHSRVLAEDFDAPEGGFRELVKTVASSDALGAAIERHRAECLTWGKPDPLVVRAAGQSAIERAGGWPGSPREVVNS